MYNAKIYVIYWKNKQNKKKARVFKVIKNF